MVMSTSARADKDKPKGAPFRPFRLAHGLVKTAAIIFGLPLTILSLMSVIGLVTDNFWARSVPALLITLVPPLFLVDRLLPADDVKRARGLPTDVLALCWLGWSLLFVGFGHPLTGGWLVREGDRFTRSGSVTLARLAYWAGGVVPEWPPPPAPPAPAATDEEDTASPDASPPAHEATEQDGSATAEGGVTRDGGDGGRQSYTTSELITRFTPAVVTVAAQGPEAVRSGTGFVIDRQGTVVTNHSLVKQAQSVKVRVPGGNWQTQVDYLSSNSKADVALLRISLPAGLVPLRLGDSDALSPDHRLLCLGNPLGLEHTVADGHLVARQQVADQAVLRTTVQISSGNAGGPLLNHQGEVVGLATTVLRDEGEDGEERSHVAIPSNTIRAMIRQDYPDRRSFGPGPDAPEGR
jgi:hypothetical protein